MRVLLLLCALAGLAGCGMGGGDGRYVVGAPYQVGGLWRYPLEDFSLNETGIAVVTSKGGGTANGESFDAANLAIAHRTLQLPAIARVTNAQPYLAPAGAPLVAMSGNAIAPAGGDQPHNNMQPYLTLNFNIALQGVFPPRT